MGKKIEVTRENSTGRNQEFKDIRTGEKMSRAELVQKIDAGKYPDYHTRKINDVRTPVSNPDKKKNNNLG